MRRSGVDFESLHQLSTEVILRKHAFDRLLNDLLGSLVDQLLEVDGLDSTRKAGMTVVHLVRCFLAGNPHLAGVDHYNVIASVYVGGVLRLMLARRRRAISVDRRPSVLPAASTTYQSRFTVSGFALRVFIDSALNAI